MGEFDAWEGARFLSLPLDLPLMTAEKIKSKKFSLDQWPDFLRPNNILGSIYY